MRLSHLILCLSIAGLGACGGADDASLEGDTGPTGDTSMGDTDETGTLDLVEAKSRVDFDTLYQLDVGHTEPPGEHWIDDAFLFMISQTGDIWGNTDQGEVDHFRFGHLLYQDDLAIEVVVEGLESAEIHAKAGVMIRRDARDPASPNVAVIYSQEEGVQMQWRDYVATMAVETKSPVPSDRPVNLRLTRTEVGHFVGEYSVDGGEVWEEIGRVMLEGWGNQVYTGVVVSSGQQGAYAQARFRELSIQGTPVAMP